MTTFDTKTDDRLVQAYAKECGNPGWGSARAAYLSKLREAMLKRFDCSAIINESGGFYLSAATVKLQDGKVLRMEKS